MENVFELLVLSDLHQASHLKTACMKFMQFNSGSVFGSDGWKSFKGTAGHEELIAEILEFPAKELLGGKLFGHTGYNTHSINAFLCVLSYYTAMSRLVLQDMLLTVES